MENQEPRGILDAAGVTHEDLVAVTDSGTREIIAFARSAVDFHGPESPKSDQWHAEIQEEQASRAKWGLAPIA